MLVQVQRLLNGTTFCASVESDISHFIEVVFNVIATIESLKLKDGFVLQLGPTIYVLNRTDALSYDIRIPDYSNPLSEQMTTDISHSLVSLISQRLLLKGLGVDGKDVLYTDHIVLAKGVLEESAIYLDRSSTVKPGDSGWYVGFVEDDSSESELYALFTYELLNIRPELMQVLMLPSEYMVIFEGSDVKVVLNEMDQNILL